VTASPSSKIRRVVFPRYGTPDVLRVDVAPRPAPRPNEIVVDVAFAGVNYADVLARRGFYKWAPPPPTCVGFEIAGTVSAIGSEVDTHRVGDRVMGVTRFGGYTDAIAIEAARAWKIPDAMPLDVAAALPAVYLTAWHAIVEVARVRRGESILIQAVAGGVGTAALQIAKHLGLVTFGTASRPEKLQKAKALGLDHAIDYAKLDFEEEVLRLTGGRGVDCVLDSLGGAGLRKGYRCLARHGRLVTIGAAEVAPRARDPLSLVKAGVELIRGGLFHPFQLIEDNRGVAGVQVLLLWDELDYLRGAAAALLALWEQKALAPVIDSIVPLERAAEAHVRLESRASTGKVLLRCGGT
jgi:NADPH:quinone reductase-like Zn-dependent oxidoreductase